MIAIVLFLGAWLLTLILAAVILAAFDLFLSYRREALRKQEEVK